MKKKDMPLVRVSSTGLLGGKNGHFSGHTLRALAAYSWGQIGFYTSLLATEDDAEYLAFCRGAIAAHERLLEEMERLEARKEAG